MNIKFRPGFKIISLLLILLSLSLLLTACQVYNGYPTTAPDSGGGKAASGPAATPRSTLPPPPTATPRPTLPAAPASQPKNTAILKDGFDNILTHYFHPLGTGDIYEVALRSIQDGLAQNGIQNPQVPIPDFSSKDTDNWNNFLQAYSLVADKYKGQVPEDSLERFAFEGTLASFQDCQTTYIPPDQSDQYLNARIGQQTLTGVGVTIADQQNGSSYTHVVASLITGGPAEKAGIKVGDQLTAVDGKDVTSLSSDQVVALIKGTTASGQAAAGSSVRLTIRHFGSSQDQTVSLTRTKILLPSMEHKILGDIGYLKIARFPILTTQNDVTTTENMITGWLKEFNQAGVKGIVLDLRDNNMGSIRLIQDYLGYFIGSDTTLYMEGKKPDQSGQSQFGTFEVPGTQDKATDKPLAVLVNPFTKGEAEVLAYAIQLNKRGTIIGQTTAGCPSFSIPIALDDSTAFNLIAYRLIKDQKNPADFVPNIQPDKVVAPDLNQLIQQGQDNQLQTAIDLLKK